MRAAPGGGVEQAPALWHPAQCEVAMVLGTSLAEQLREQLNEIAEDERLA